MSQPEIIAIIPARSGSKGLPDKNIKNFAGKPLLAHTIIAAQQSGIFSEIFVSTDSEKYATIARQYGASVPFLRAGNLATDNAKIADVIVDLIWQLRKNGKKYSTFMLLQPTSPLRTAIDIRDSYNYFLTIGAKNVVGVCEAEHSPLWMNTLPENGSMENFLQNINRNRQELPQYYRINGAIYIAEIENYLVKKSFYERDSYAFKMPKERSVDIDSELDFLWAETILNYYK